MRVVRVGLAPVKGLRHESVPVGVLDAGGMRGDRAVALVDPVAGATLKSAENGILVQARGVVDGDDVRVTLPDGSVHEQPLAGGDERRIAYWGRQVDARIVGGPVATALSEWLGRDILLAPAPDRGAFIWDTPVSVVLTSELRELAGRLGRPDLVEDLGRYRANLVLADDDSPPPRPGDRLRVGGAVLELTGEIDRCAVMDHHPLTGESDAPVMKELARYRRTTDGIMLGLKARVIRPGEVREGDDATPPDEADLRVRR